MEVYKLNYCNILHDDMLNGDNLGVVLFVSGCKHFCKECQNKDLTWDFNGGIAFDENAKKEIFKELENKYIFRITYSGGCPLCMPNREVITELAEEIKHKYPNIKQWCYCGEIWEDIKDLPIMQYIDVLVDGKFIEDLADVNYPWAGSTNQRVIDVKKSLEQGEVVLWRSK